MPDYLTIKKLAADAGFDRCGIAPCRPLPQHEVWFGEWLRRGFQSSLGYMERNVSKRFDPARLMEGARTVVVCAVGYKNLIGGGYAEECRTKIASYACAADYHTAIRRMLGGMLEALREKEPRLGGRVFVDTAPLAEKQWAVEAGLGWIGRQSLLVTPRLGSYVLLGELVLDAETDRYDTPYAGSGCGDCRRCVDACPTGAVVSPHVIDTRRCISCHTVEKQPETKVDLHGWIFGCDACQSCCPYNRIAPQHANPAFDPVFDPRTMDAGAWLSLDEKAFERLCGATPLTRSGVSRIRANVLRNEK